MCRYWAHWAIVVTGRCGADHQPFLMGATTVGFVWVRSMNRLNCIFESIYRDESAARSSLKDSDKEMAV